MKNTITKLNTTENVTLITLNNIPVNHKIIARIFTNLGETGLNIDMISQTSPLKGTISISFTLPDDDLFTAIQTLKIFKNEIKSLRIEVNSNNTKISLYGDAMKTSPGSAAKTMEVLSNNDIDIKMITTSEVDISYLIYASDQQRAVKVLNELIEK